MTKSDKSIHNICIAAIKRSTIKPYDFRWTKFYETNSDFTTDLPLDIKEEELIICSVIIDYDNYSILTTRQLITKQAGQVNKGNIEGAIDKSYGYFKGYKDTLYTLGKVHLKSGGDLIYFIETGNASMIMIHCVRTLIHTQEMSGVQISNVTRIWNKKNEN